MGTIHVEMATPPLVAHKETAHGGLRIVSLEGHRRRHKCSYVFGICVCVCMCTVHMCVLIHLFAHGCGGQKASFGIVLQTLSTCSFEIGSLIDLGLVKDSGDQ